jgi:chemotaxis family two-component system sensor kinase Cph1
MAQAIPVYSDERLVARQMVEKHGGELWVESVVGQGTTFFLSLSKHL